MKLLHIDSSILADQSVSRHLSAAIVEKLRAEVPGIDVIYRDLVRQSLDHFTLAAAPAKDPHGDLLPGAEHDPQAMVISESILEEFIAADIVVIGAPMYNFTVSSQLKAWIDRILIAGRTFSYSPEGPVSLVSGKSVILAISRGGLYGADSPTESFEHLETYLRAVFGFLGLQPQTILAEGVAYGPEHREAAITSAAASIAQLQFV